MLPPTAINAGERCITGGCALAYVAGQGVLHAAAGTRCTTKEDGDDVRIRAQRDRLLVVLLVQLRHHRFAQYRMPAPREPLRGCGAPRGRRRR